MKGIPLGTSRFRYPTDGCGSLIAENQSVYEFTGAKRERFWELFGEAKAALDG